MKKYLVSDALRMKYPCQRSRNRSCNSCLARGENSAYEILENEGHLQVSAALPMAA